MSPKSGSLFSGELQAGSGSGWSVRGGRFSAASGNHLLDHGIEGRCNVSEKREVGAARRSCNTGCTSDEVTAKHNTDTSFPSKLEGR